MSDTVLPLLTDLLRFPGLPGRESALSRRLEKEWGRWSHELTFSRIGSLHASRHGNGPEPRPTVMLTAHMDSIGFMVWQVVAGLLKVSGLGSVDPRPLPGQAVVVHGSSDIPGLLVEPPQACLPAREGQAVTALRELWVDLGLPARRVQRAVKPGDPVSFAQEHSLLTGDCLSGPGLDNRASLVALTLCLQELARRAHDWDVVAVATVQEEEGLAGAGTSAFLVRPAMAIVVDVTFGRGPGSPEHLTFPLGEGPTNGWGPEVHPAIYARLKQTAQENGIPLTDEILPTRSGTEAATLQLAGGGVPTGIVSIPIRYMHTPVEVVHLSDIRHTGKLLAGFVAGLGPEALEDLVVE